MARTIICPACSTTYAEVVAPPAPAPTPQPTPAPQPQPQPPPALLGVPIGTMHLPRDRHGDPSLSYNASVFNADAGTLLADLAAIRKLGGRVVLSLKRSAQQDASGLSVLKAVKEITSWPDFTEFVKDGTVPLVYTGDDITATEWGTKPLVDKLAMWDDIADAVRQRWDVGVVMRAKASELAVRPIWKAVTTCWAQYKGPGRDGAPFAYRDKQVADARALKMTLAIWMNYLDGGDGSSKILGTYENAAAVHRWQVSAAELLTYGKIFLPVTLAAIGWRWSLDYSSGTKMVAGQMDGIRAFDARPDVRANMKELRALADTLPRPSWKLSA